MTAERAAADAEVTLLLDGEQVRVPAGRTLAAAMLERGIAVLGRTPDGGVRGLYCGMGSCCCCLVEVEGRGAVRACLEPVAEGLVVTTGGAR